MDYVIITIIQPKVNFIAEQNFVKIGIAGQLKEDQFRKKSLKTTCIKNTIYWLNITYICITCFISARLTYKCLLYDMQKPHTSFGKLENDVSRCRPKYHLFFMKNCRQFFMLHEIHIHTYIWKNKWTNMILSTYFVDLKHVSNKRMVKPVELLNYTR